MKYIKEFEDFEKLENDSSNLNEQTIQYKRKYTETHPRKIVYSGAKVRKLVFDSMKDGTITEEQLLKVLKEFNAENRWHKKNKHLFVVAEEAGTRVYKLSKLGHLVREKISLISNTR